MTRETILRNRLEMATHNLQCHSRNWAMTEPKDGCEAEHKEAAEEVEMLQAWLKEFHRSRSDSKVTYIGYLSTASYAPCTDGKARANEMSLRWTPGLDSCMETAESLM